MASNPLMMAGVHRLENQFGPAKNWPDEEVEKIYKVANRSADKFTSHTYSVDRVRDMIERGFLTQYVVDESGRDKQWVRDLVQFMRASPGFEYRATHDDLVQLRYVRDHISSKHYSQIARSMDRHVDWARHFMPAARRLKLD